MPRCESALAPSRSPEAGAGRSLCTPRPLAVRHARSSGTPPRYNRGCRGQAHLPCYAAPPTSPVRCRQRSPFRTLELRAARTVRSPRPGRRRWTPCQDRCQRAQRGPRQDRGGLACHRSRPRTRGRGARDRHGPARRASMVRPRCRFSRCRSGRGAPESATLLAPGIRRDQP